MDDFTIGFMFGWLLPVVVAGIVVLTILLLGGC